MLVISVVASLLFSFAPVLHFLRPDLANALRQNAGTATKRSQRFRKVAVGVQIALSVLLLGGAGLFVRTLDNLRHQSVGFETANLATFTFDPTISGYNEDRTSQIETSALDALRRIPGVTYTAFTTDPELSGDTNGSNFTVQGYKATEEENMNFEVPWIASGYFATLRQPLLAGREFTPSDAKGAPLVAIVNLSFAKRFYGSAQNALGRAIGQGGGSDVKLDTTIVGVVGDIKHQDLRTDIGPAVYRSCLQNPHPTGVQIYVRTANAPETVESAIRQTIHTLDPTLVVNGLRTMEAQVDSSASQERALAFLAIGFSLLATILAAVGLYGVLAYSTEQRTREIGVRMALGANRGSVVVLVLRGALWLIVIGLLGGLPLSVMAERFLGSQLYGINPFDATVTFVAVLALGLSALIASVIPALRASSTSPLEALRSE
jgi:predicted permease